MSRAKTAIILLVTVPLFLMAFCSAAVSQDASSPTGTDKSDSNSAEDRVDGSSDDAQGNVAPIVFQTIDQIIETLKHIGDSEDIADWQEYRAQAEAGGDRQFPLEVAGYSAKLANDMEKHNELLSADKLITDSLKIAPTIQADNPALFANIHYVAATIDIDFERYESSLQHLSTSLQIAEETGLERHVIVAFRAQRAFALRKLKRYDESEQIYSELIQLATEKADGLSQDDIYKLKLALAAMYAEKGAFRQYRDTCPDLDKHHVFEDGTRDWEGQLPKGIAFVNYQLAEGHDFK